MLVQAHSPPSTPDASSLPPNHFAFEIEVRTDVDRFVVTIDGEPGALREYVLDKDESLSRSFEVEVFYRATGAFLDRTSVAAHCTRDSFWGDVVRERLGVSGRNGHLIQSGSTCHERSGGVGVTENGESDCWDFWWSCAGERCGLRQVHEDPSIVHLACTSAGTLKVGDACDFGAPGPENFDACQTGSGCVDGLCRPFCLVTWPPPSDCEGYAGAQCVPVEGLDADYMGVCRYE